MECAYSGGTVICLSTGAAGSLCSLPSSVNEQESVIRTASCMSV